MTMLNNKKTTPLKAIRLKCLDCCCNSSKEVNLCIIPECPLFQFRYGKNPYIKRNLDGKAKELLRTQLEKNKLAKH